MTNRQLTRLGRGGPTAPPAERMRYLVRGTIAPRFVEARALSAADAMPFAPADEREQRAFKRMIGEGSLRVASANRVYLDMTAYEAAAAARRRRLLPWLFVVPVIVAALAVLFYRG